MKTNNSNSKAGKEEKKMNRKVTNHVRKTIM
jgi:hypothetical protein